jgi:hypothetical protein
MIDPDPDEIDEDDRRELFATYRAIIKLMMDTNTSPMMMVRACLGLVSSSIAENHKDFDKMKASAEEAGEKLVATAISHWMTENDILRQ